MLSDGELIQVRVISQAQRARRARIRFLACVVVILGIQIALGVPAAAQSCGQPPPPESPHDGVLAILDAPIPSRGDSSTVYGQYGYAGQTWYAYDPGCAFNPAVSGDTGFGNAALDVAKTGVATANGLYYASADNSAIRYLDTVDDQYTNLVFDHFFGALVGLALLLVAVVMLRRVWAGEFATVTRKTLWVLAALGIGSLAVIGPVYTVLEHTLLHGITQIQQGFTFGNPSDSQINQFPQALHDQIVYNTWLRGEFGSDNSPQAQRYGHNLVDAQAWTKTDTPDTMTTAAAAAKNTEYQTIANQLASTDESFTGSSADRAGLGILSTVQALAYTVFPSLAGLAVLACQIALRVAILGSPIIGLIGVLNHQLLRRVLNIVAAIAVYSLIFAALAGANQLLITTLFTHHLPDVVAIICGFLIELACAAIIIALWRGHGGFTRRDNPNTGEKKTTIGQGHYSVPVPDAPSATNPQTPIERPELHVQAQPPILALTEDDNENLLHVLSRANPAIETLALWAYAASRGTQSLPPAIVRRLMDVITNGGPNAHVVQRHYGKTDQILIERLGKPKYRNGVLQLNRRTNHVETYDNIDPARPRPLPNDRSRYRDMFKPRNHRSGSYATTFTNEEDLVKCAAKAWALYRQNGTPSDDFPISDVLGPNGHLRMKGFYLDPSNPTRALPADLKGGSVKFIFEFDRNGKPYLYSMYPQPTKRRHP